MCEASSPTPSAPSPTITLDLFLVRTCPHCQADTVHVGAAGWTCLQCIADGGTCCSLTAYNRWG